MQKIVNIYKFSRNIKYKENSGLYINYTCSLYYNLLLVDKQLHCYHYYQQEVLM